MTQIASFGWRSCSDPVNLALPASQWAPVSVNRRWMTSGTTEGH